MRHIPLLVKFVLAAALAGGCSNKDDRPTNMPMRWHFQAGQKFHVHCVQSSDTSLKWQTVLSDDKSESVVDYLCSVDSVDDHGSARITMVVERVRLKTRSPKVNVDIDTSKATDNMPTMTAVQTEVVKKIIADLKIRFRVDNRGKVLEADVDDDAIKEWTSIIPGLQDRISEKEISKTLRQLLPILPEKPIAIGDTWNDNLEFNRSKGPGFHSIHVKYRYVSPMQYKNRKVDKVVSEAQLGWDNENMPKGVSVKIVSQENPGVFYFDNQAGQMVEIENSQKRTLEYSKDGRTVHEETNAASEIEFSPVEH